MAVINGTLGNDEYAGTVGVNDTAVIAALQSKMRFSFDGSNWTATGPAGTDRLVSIEQLQLNDALFTMSVGGEVQVNTTTLNDQMEAQTTRLNNGSYVVTWRSSAGDNSGTAIFSQLYNAAGEKIGGETLVNTYTINDQVNPAITRLSGGGYAIAWASIQDGSSYGIYVQRFDALGAKVGVETPVNTYTTLSQNMPAISSLPTGGFVIVWQSDGQDGSGIGIYSQRFDSSGAKVGVETPVNTTTNLAQTVPDVAVLTNGGYVVSWRSVETNGSTFGPYDLFFQLFDSSGAKVGGEIKVDPAGVGYIESPTIAALPTGGFLLAWESSDGSSGGVFTQRFDATGAKVGEQTLVNTTTFSNQGAPEIAILSGGGYVVVWQGFVQSRYMTFAQMFDANGAKVGEETQISTYFTANQQILPDVAGLANGGYVVTWNAAGDGSGSAVYAMRYNADGTPALPTITGDDLPNVINATGDRPVWLSGREGNDTLSSGAGADWLDGGTGTDTMTGGAGDDTYIADAGDRIVELVDGGTDTARVTTSYTITSPWLENVTLLGTAAGNLTGNSLANQLLGNAADNVLNGGLGPDRMVGRGGNDTYFVEDALTLDETDPTALDVVVEEANAGVDTVVSEISYALGANVEILRLVGTNALNGTGNTLDNQLTGNAAANRLDGGMGDDILIGDEGNDTYVVDARDQVIEAAGEGTDTVEASTSWVLGANVENLILTGTANFTATGNELDNVLIGNSGANILDGGEGVDVMNGGDGNDVYIVEDDGDTAAEFSATGGIDLVKSTVSHALGGEIENLTLLGTAAISGTGNLLNNVIKGNSAANVLNGGSGIDSLYGGYGDDTLISSDGRDMLYGGVGNDAYVVSGEGDEIVELSGQGTDTVTAFVSRAYTLRLNVENLVLQGGNVNGYGNSLANQITGTIGNNILDGAAGADRMTGLAGNDTYVVDNASDVVVEDVAQGTDQVLSSVTYTLGLNVENLTLTGAAVINGTGNELANRLTGNDANNTLTGAGGNDTLVGAGGADRLLGGIGNDKLTGGIGNDLLDGGDGVDTASYFAATSGVTVNLTLTVAQNTVAAGSDTLLGIEDLEGSSVGNDVLTGNASANRISGFGGNDVLQGLAGNDRLYGGDGDDLIYADADDDIIDGGSGRDKMTFVAVAADVTVDLNLTGHQNTGAGLDRIVNVEDIEGSATGNDRLIGDDEDNALFGLGGNDRLAGGGGADTLDGGDGVDTADYSGAFGDVIVDLTAGTSNEDGSGTSDILVSIENVIGSDFDDVLIGDGGANLLDGRSGIDIMRGGAGNDTYVVDTTADRITESSAADGIDTVQSSISFTLGTNFENLVLTGTSALSGTGNSLANTLTGNVAANTLTGADGADNLFGNAGSDRLVGGTGADNFYFDTALGTTNVDAITDFVVADDTIQLSRSIFTGIGANGALAASAFRVGTAALDADDRIVYDSATGKIYYDADGNGAGAAMLFATVTAGTALTNLDFNAYLI